MFFTTSEFDSLDESKLREFLDLKISEFYYVDYKEAIEYNDHFKKEFLKDLSAFANAFGGNLIYGVKEPKEDLTTENQIQGIKNAEDLIKKFEKLAQAGLDPRIPGFKMKPIKIKDKNPVIVVHIPPSISKPHMINYDCNKKWIFYKRGIESNLPMNTQQIRNAVQYSYSAENDAIKFLNNRESLYKEHRYSDLHLTFFYQATPLIRERKGEFLDENEFKEAYPSPKYNDVIDSRNVNLFYPTMHGYKAKYHSSRHYSHEFIFNRNGYMESILKIGLKEEKEINNKIVRVSEPIAYYFKSILSHSDELINKLNYDLPYLIRCKLFNAKKFRYKKMDGTYITYEYPEMEWSQIFRNVGESIEKLGHDKWIKELYNAFGKHPVSSLLQNDEE